MPTTWSALAYYVQLPKFEELTGYTSDAFHAKRRKGEWREGVHFRVAPDGRILMDLRAYHEWAEGQHQAA